MCGDPASTANTFPTDNHKETMNEDEPFLRALLANPDDRTTRLVYADWLDDRADPRAEYLRLGVRVADLPCGHDERQLRRRMLERQIVLPLWWVAIAGGLRATPSDDWVAGVQIEAAARLLGRPTKWTDADGYELEISGAAISGLTGAIAYLESRSKWRDRFHDIHYHLRLRDGAGREVAWEPETYNPFFGCDVKFLEWYGDAVIFIYREKHGTYAARFGFDAPVRFHRAEDYWVLDGNELGFVGHPQTSVSRLSVPGLEVLPPLTSEEAAGRELLPTKPSWA
jgi:uncharacterized protein (TIGR02996 family)